MSTSFRHPQIINLVRKNGMVTVDDLANHFDVSVQTIRRDLGELADSGIIDRVHGGAVLAARVANIGYEDRKTINHDGKTRIAKLCAAKIPENSVIFLNIGTSTEAVARELLNHRNVMVVTNNLNVANILVANPECKIVVTGGDLRRSDGALIGPPAIETIKRFKFDLAIIGCSALDQDGDLLDYDIQETSVSQTILSHSRRAYLVADHTKFNRTAPVKIASLSDVDCFFTDAPVTRELENLCAAWNTKIVLA